MCPPTYEIVFREQIAPETYRYLVRAPEIARHHQAGQFVVLRVLAQGERFPLTVVSADPEEGAIELIFQVVGVSTRALAAMGPGDAIMDLAGPLGHPTRVEHFGRCVVIGGGYGMAPVLPIAAALKAAGNYLIGINGARSAQHVILEERLRAICDRVEVCTDDGSYGHRGFVTDVLRDAEAMSHRLRPGYRPDTNDAGGRRLTGPRHAIVILNPIMIDGTGMCGGCRVEVVA